MTLSLRAVEGDWGGAPLSNIEAVARSAAAAFAAFDDDESVAIVLEATAHEDECPVTLSRTNSSGEFVVRLNVPGNRWARLAYQFAHEYCHVLADPTTWPGPEGRFAWIEEALAETASLFALCRMAKAWAVEPPYPNWRSYAASLAEYEAECISDPTRCLPPGMSFPVWLSTHLPLLEADSGRRDDNTIVAKEILPIFEANEAAWRVVRCLHFWPWSSAESVVDFMDGWAKASLAQGRSVVGSIAGVIGGEM